MQEAVGPTAGVAGRQRAPDRGRGLRRDASREAPDRGWGRAGHLPARIGR